MARTLSLLQQVLSKANELQGRVGAQGSSLQIRAHAHSFLFIWTQLQRQAV